MSQRAGSGRYVVLGVAVLSVETVIRVVAFGGDIASGSVFWGALLAGYLCKRQGIQSSPVGFRIGLLGGLPAVVGVLVELDTPPTGAGEIASVAVVLVLLVGAIAIIATLGAHLGGWVAQLRGHPREMA